MRAATSPILRCPMSFRLWTIFYVFALLASAMATFAPALGIGLAGTVCAFWWIVFGGPGPQKKVPRVLLIIGIACWLFLLLLVLPSVQSAGPTSYRNTCLNNLRLLALTLLNYRDSKGKFPPAYIVDANGRPLLSWRMAMLPYFEQSGLPYVDVTKAWNDPANTAIASTAIVGFSCPSRAAFSTTTDYSAIVGPQTMWPGANGISSEEIRDGAANTIMLIEAHRASVSWAEPGDLCYDEALALLTKPAAADDGHRADDGFFYKPVTSRNVAFADGSVRSLRLPLDRIVASALLTADGGEQIDMADLDKSTRPTLYYARCYGFAVFVILSILPAELVGRQKRRIDSESQPNPNSAAEHSFGAVEGP